MILLMLHTTVTRLVYRFPYLAELRRSPPLLWASSRAGKRGEREPGRSSFRVAEIVLWEDAKGEPR
jgi:hypothetical protein